jgi:hypothetical protein
MGNYPPRTLIFKHTKSLKTMKRHLLLFLASALLTGSAIGQVVPNVDWVRNYSERDLQVNIPSAIDANNNVYVTGYTVFQGTNDYTTIKYDASGTQQWVKHYNGMLGGQDASNAIVLDAAGNIYVTGESDGVGTRKDFATIKYDASGTQVWAVRYNNTLANDDDIALSIVVDGSGNVYVTGKSKNQNATFDYATVKYNSSGAQQWVQRHGALNTNDVAVAVGVGNGNRVFVTGTSKTTTQADNLVTIGYNANNGNVLWTSSINGTSNGNDAAYGLLVDGNNVLVTGMVNNTGTNEDYILAKLNASTGATNFAVTYNGYGSSDYSTAIVKDGGNNYILIGVSRNPNGNMEYHTVKYSQNGTQQWVNKRSINQSFVQVSPKIAVDFVDHLYVCGETMNNNSDALLYQITPGGNATWTETHNGLNNGNDVAVDLVMTGIGQIYLAAQTQNSNAKFDYTTIKYSQTPIIFPPDILNEVNDPNYLFYENSGQIIDLNNQLVPDIKFYTNGHSPTIYFKNSGLSYVFSKMDTLINTPDSIHRVDLKFLDANINSIVYSFEEGIGHLNYFLGHIPNGITDVKGSQRVMIPNIYPHIDLHYYSNSAGLKYYFVVKPGGNPNMIGQQFDGASSTGINSNNELVLNTTLGIIILKQPLAYQVNPALQTVPLNQAYWVNTTQNDYKFQLPNYNPALPLIILVGEGGQPLGGGGGDNLEWSTYYGGNGIDVGYSIVNDPAGNIFVGGYVQQSNFPTTVGAFQITQSDMTNGVLMAFNSLRQRQWATFYGGSDVDEIRSLTYFNNQLYTTGYTFSTDFPTFFMAGADNDQVHAGNADAFLAQVNPANGYPTWARFYGGIADDRGFSLFSKNNFLYVTGYTGGGIPIINLPGAHMQNTYGGGFSDGYVVKLNIQNQLVWSTFYGGSGTDYSTSARVDNTGNLYIWGWTNSTNFGTQNSGGYFENAIAGDHDCFLLKFDVNGTRKWATFFGGSQQDRAAENDGIAFNSNGIFLIGTTLSNNLNTLDYLPGTTYFQPSYSGASDVFLIGFDYNDNLIWSTYLQGNDIDEGEAIASDLNGNLYITGTTKSGNFPSVSLANAYTQSYAGSNNATLGDVFISAFNSNNFEMKWSTHVGGSSPSSILGGDIGYSLSTFQNSKLYLTGGSASTNPLYPLANPGNGAAYFPSYGGGFADIIISEFNLSFILLKTDDIESNNFILEVYPNPTNGVIKVVFPAQFNSAHLKLTNLLGEIVLERYISNETGNTIDVSGLSNGVYLVTIFIGDTSFTAKLIKE